MKYTQRAGAMLVAASMLLSMTAFAEEVPEDTPVVPAEATETVAPTETSEAPVATEAPVETEAPVVTEAPVGMETPLSEETPDMTEAPEEAATEVAETTETPEATETPEVTEEPEATETPEVTEEPEATETPEVTEVPEATETPEVTEEPETTETPEVTEEPETTETPEVTETPEATEDPTETTWDESQCTHTTLDCEQAPTCDIEGCQHIGMDVNGLDLPFCSAGRWLLDQQDGLGIAMYSNTQKTIDLNRADAAFYRSGEYALIGDERPSSAVRVIRNRAAVLTLRSASVGTLTVEEGATVYLHVQSGTTATIQKLNIQAGATVIFSQGGTLHVNDVQSSGEVYVQGASVNAKMTESAGRVCTTFAADGVQNVLVEGENATWRVTPDENGKVYLWLPRASEGMVWTPTVSDGTMTLRQTAKVPQGKVGTVNQGQRNALTADTTYILKGDVQEGTVLEIMESGVTLVLEDVNFQGTLVEAGKPYQLVIRGETILDGVEDMPLLGSEPTIAIDGLLSVSGELPSGTTITSGVAFLSHPLNGWTAWKVFTPLSRQTVTLEGEPLPLLMTLEGDLLLPPLKQDCIYSINADADAITVETVHQQVLTFALSDNAAAVEAGDAERFIINGTENYVRNGTIHASGASSVVTMRGVKVQSNESILRVENGAMNVTLTGDNALISDGASPITLQDATLTLTVESGRLVLRGQSSLSGITLRGNIMTDDALAKGCTVITVRDEQGNPVPNQALTVLLGGETYKYTTHFDGTLRLWGFDNLSGTDVAITDGETVYTAVISGTAGDAVTGLEITDIQTKDMPDGTMVITIQTNGAKTVGVQLYAGEAPASMPDTYAADAQHYLAENGQVTVSGLNKGDVVIFRVFASATENVALTAENADGFSFSEECFHVHRVKWTPSNTANTTYNAQTYRPRMTLPETAKITYSGNRLVGGLPFYVGSYVMHVTIPEGDPLYLADTVDVAFNIQKISLVICPDANQQKNEGEADPVTYTYTSTGLLSGDVITGVLTREMGEEAGNYPFVITGLSAPDYYNIVLMEDAPEFTIMPTDSGWGWWGGGDRLTPVQQTIERSDGRKLFVTINTQEQLILSHSELGSVVRNTEDEEVKPFTPSLSWNKQTDEVLLRISAEAELNKDAGYVTDSYGNPVWGSRTLRMGYMSLRYMNNAGVDAICFSNKNAAVLLRIEDFLSADMEKAIKQAGGNLTSTSFRITIEPVELPDGAVEGGWNIRAEMYINRQYFDITPYLPGAQVLVSLESVAELLENLERYDEKTFPQLFALREDGVQQESVYVAPYQDEELTLVLFPSMMFSNRYLTMPLEQNGTVDIMMLQLPDAEEATEENQ